MLDQRSERNPSRDGFTIYQLKCEVNEENASLVPENLSEVDLWHQRLGHLNRQQLNTLVDRKLASGINLSTTSQLSLCEKCVEGKMQRKPFKSLMLVLVYSDVCWPQWLELIVGSRYFATFVNDCSRCVAVHFIENKRKVLEKYKIYETKVTKQCGEPIMKLRTDNGSEYMLKEFQG